MKIKVRDAADLVGGVISGNPDAEFDNVSKIEEAVEGDLTFLYHPSYIKHLDSTKAKIILIKDGIELKRDDLTYIISDNPLASLQKILTEYFTTKINLKGIHPSAVIDPSVKLGNNVAIGANVVISKGCRVGDNTKIMQNTVLLENVLVGKNSLLYPNVTVREDCVIGDNVIIHSSTVIGSDGFGFTPDEKGVYQKIPQIGNVIIEDDVELGSNVSVDRASLGSTIIRKGVKIDNLVQVAHNVIIGENTVISAQSGISGSTKVGKNCMFGGQVGVVGHIEIADGTLIGAQSGVAKAITKGGKYFGSPAREIGFTMRLEAHFKNLPKYVERIQNLEKKIEELEKQNQKVK
ncbi:udp-3-o- glucosamine n-acyltransferase [hydrocarbon metagenome]|uniref:Udp-3-o-glucosamine n-acyltransferase n=1 Tax=hydrocarbon metagenome TaxID=938273 RepID=A0A0W8G0P9_9ZZZZ